MNKRAYIFYFAVIFAGVMVSFFAGKKYAMEDMKVSQTNITASSQEESKKIREGYWLKLEHNKIVIYDQKRKKIIAETDIERKDCSVKDSHLLEQGIYMETMESLFKFLQAHTS